MRSKMVLAIVLLMGFLAVGCQNKPEPSSQAEQILKGEHKLRKMTERTDVNSSISGIFFLFIGNLSGTSKTTVSVKFAWEMNDGIYAISSLPLEKIRVKLEESATTPTIKFRWLPYRRMGVVPQVQTLMDGYVSYAVVTVRESDWPIQVSLPLNSQ